MLRNSIREIKAGIRNDDGRESRTLKFPPSERPAKGEGGAGRGKACGLINFGVNEVSMECLSGKFP